MLKDKSNQHACRAVLILSFAALAACGGGGETLPADVQPTAVQSSDGTQANENRVHIASLSSIESTSTPDSVSTTSDAGSTLQLCKLMAFGNTPGSYRCRLPASGPTDIYGTTTGDGVGIGPAILQCQTTTVGQAFVAPTPPPGNEAADGSGTHSCFQLVLGSQTSTYFDVSLPTGVTGLAELYIDANNGAGFKLAGVQSPDGHLNIPFTNQNARMVLTVHTDNGTQGQQMSIGVGVAAPALAASNSPSMAANVLMNQGSTGTIANPGVDQWFFFYALRPSQTTAEISATFTANQTAGFRSVQQTGPNTYVLGAETAIPYSASGASIAYTSPNPANSSSTTTPYGVMVRVSGANASAPANEGFSVRVGTRANAINSASLTNTEAISRWYPAPGLLEAARSITTNITVKDPNGNLLVGETVGVSVQSDTTNAYTVQNIQGVTDGYGSLVITVPLAACTGTVQTKFNYGPPGSPTDHYNGTAQDGMVTQRLINSAGAPQTVMPFKRICTETYLGRY